MYCSLLGSLLFFKAVNAGSYAISVDFCIVKVILYQSSLQWTEYVLYAFVHNLWTISSLVFCLMFKKKTVKWFWVYLFSLMYTHLITPYCHNVALPDLFFFLSNIFWKGLCYCNLWTPTYIHWHFNWGFIFFFISKTDALKLQAVIWDFIIRYNVHVFV